MTEKTEALRLAEFYEALAEEPPKSPDNSDIRATAAKLRRLVAVEAQRDALLEALKEIDSWLVCSCIATAEDMAQSFPHMQQVASAAIKAVEEEA